MSRYDTGDYVEGLETESVCECGNPSPYVKQVLGRDDDYVILPDGRQIGRLDVAFKGIDGLLEAQIEQSAPDRIIIRYIGNEGCDHPVLTNKLENSLKERLGSSLSYEFTPVKDLPRTRRGKFKSVIRSFDIA
jgi:phenylacetate-CoA ligase